MRLASARYDGADLAPLTEAVPARAIEPAPNGRRPTDAYTHEPLAYGDVPRRSG